MLHFHARSVHEYINNIAIIEIQYNSQQSISTQISVCINMNSKLVIIKCVHDNLTNSDFFFLDCYLFLDMMPPGGLMECSPDSQ